jgi:hypothetical protein
LIELASTSWPPADDRDQHDDIEGPE